MGQDKLIQQLAECAATCNMCYNACLNEEDVSMMARCIELDRECADICQLTASILARDSENKEKYLSLCADICELCAEECGKHDNDHCRKCGEVCKKCAEDCGKMAVA
ncbi:MAG: hypothetical protein JWO03_3589 [Bacteroidetes bacterium]|nr:hypothetical protein [Bacteroidota bacterium]